MNSPSLLTDQPCYFKSVDIIEDILRNQLLSFNLEPMANLSKSLSIELARCREG